ncbi:branched-chain amino acid transport system II carrier protein [Bacillus sp. SL00103]
MILYLSIGPFFAIPRTGTVSYEIGLAPFLSGTQATSWIPLFIFTVVFFTISYLLALNPSKAG